MLGLYVCCILGLHLHQVSSCKLQFPQSGSALSTGTTLAPITNFITLQSTLAVHSRVKTMVYVWQTVITIAVTAHGLDTSE